MSFELRWHENLLWHRRRSSISHEGGSTMPKALSAFLARNSVTPSEELPLVHTTRSYNLRLIFDGDNLEPQPCDVFEGDDLNYFFVGRPAYKYHSDSGTAEHWELPCCFIFEAASVGPVKRVFPFDSGAFNSRRYPSYINSMSMSEFEVNGYDAVGKIIGSFFGSAKRYFDLKPKSDTDFKTEYSITAFDAEIMATLKLASETTPNTFDDRRLCIEVQSEEPVTLTGSKMLAVVLPEIYLDEDGVRDRIQNVWGAEPIGYQMFSLNVASYHGMIYNEILKFYERRGLL